MERKKDLSIFTSYKKIWNSVNRQLKKSANEYSKNIFENITESKQKWKLIKNKLQKDAKGQKISKIRANGEIVETKKDIANTLNNCFAKLGLYKGENEDLALPNFTYQKTEFSFRPITRKELSLQFNSRQSESRFYSRSGCVIYGHACYIAKTVQYKTHFQFLPM